MLYVMQSCAVLSNRMLALPLQPAFLRGSLQVITALGLGRDSFSSVSGRTG